MTELPDGIQQLIQELDELQKVFPPVYTKFRYGQVQYKRDNLNGLCLWSETGCLSFTWGNISELEILKAQRLWAVDRQLRQTERLK